jgi:hypothetical protein
VETAPVSARRRVTVVEDEGAAFVVPRLLLRRPSGPAAPGTVAWELCYGGQPIASGSMSGDQEVLSTGIESVRPAMDSLALTLIARYDDGRPAAIEATCVRPGPPPTRAEAMARAKWPGARDQPEPPEVRRPLLAEAREIFPPVPAAGPDGGPRRRRVFIYQHVSVLLTVRRQRMRGREPMLPQAAGARAGGPADG